MLCTGYNRNGFTKPLHSNGSLHSASVTPLFSFQGSCHNMYSMYLLDDKPCKIFDFQQFLWLTLQTKVPLASVIQFLWNILAFLAQSVELGLAKVSWGFHCMVYFFYSLSLISFYFIKQEGYLPILQEAYKRPTVRIKLLFLSIKKRMQLQVRNWYRIPVLWTTVWDWKDGMKRESLWGQEHQLQWAKWTLGM